MPLRYLKYPTTTTATWRCVGHWLPLIIEQQVTGWHVPVQLQTITLYNDHSDNHEKNTVYGCAFITRLGATDTFIIYGRSYDKVFRYVLIARISFPSIDAFSLWYLLHVALTHGRHGFYVDYKCLMCRFRSVNQNSGKINLTTFNYEPNNTTPVLEGFSLRSYAHSFLYLALKVNFWHWYYWATRRRYRDQLVYSE